jgi:hypothetical protein
MHLVLKNTKGGPKVSHTLKPSNDECKWPVSLSSRLKIHVEVIGLFTVDITANSVVTKYSCLC